MHPSLLPKHRGPTPVRWALRNGDAEIGFTVHRTAGDFDTGPILAQDRIAIADDDDGNAILERLTFLFPGFVQQALERIARGAPVEPQDEAQTSYAGEFDDAWRVIDWRQPARAIHNQVRSWSLFGDGTDGARGDVDGQMLQIAKTRFSTQPGITAAPPGTV